MRKTAEEKKLDAIWPQRRFDNVSRSVLMAKLARPYIALVKANLNAEHTTYVQVVKVDLLTELARMPEASTVSFTISDGAIYVDNC